MQSRLYSLACNYRKTSLLDKTRTLNPSFLRTRGQRWDCWRELSLIWERSRRVGQSYCLRTDWTPQRRCSVSKVGVCGKLPLLIRRKSFFLSRRFSCDLHKRRVQNLGWSLSGVREAVLSDLYKLKDNDLWVFPICKKAVVFERKVHKTRMWEVHNLERSLWIKMRSLLLTQKLNWGF